MVETIQWTDAGVVMIDQTRLPREQKFVTCRSYHEVADAIKTMVIRGAPAIGVAAAMGVALGVRKAPTSRRSARRSRHASYRGESVLGDRPDAEPRLRSTARQRGDRASAWSRKPSRSAWKTSPSARRSDETARRWFPTARPC